MYAIPFFLVSVHIHTDREIPIFILMRLLLVFRHVCFDGKVRFWTSSSSVEFSLWIHINNAVQYMRDNTSPH